MAIRPNKAQRFLWWFFPVAVFLAAYFTVIYESKTAYLYPHEEAKVYFGNFHDEGYESIDSVKYIGKPNHPLLLPSELEGVVDGETASSEVTMFTPAAIIEALIEIDKVFQMNRYGCPDGLSAYRSENGWIYEVTPKIKSKKHRKEIESCLGMTIAGVYAVNNAIYESEISEKKAEKERKASWETAPKPE